mmetsp:Transcript_3517/g.9404  ORF Transcript_3517/g.9404 Transcript_3517/m.9404 type:complete len:332 (-) Transcript_3517:223-1218(-)
MAGSPSDAVGGQAVHVEEHHDTAYEALYFLFLSLTIGAAARGAVRNSRLPYTVALLFVGLAIGFLYSYADLGVLSNSLDIWVAIGPHTMLSVFLPALVFESAFSLEWHTFRKCAAQVLWLAGPGVLLGTFLMGALLKATLPYGWGWGSSLMLGSILSATDPVAVVALLKEVGASKRLGHIIEGESLVNDGTAIVVFSLHCKRRAKDGARDLHVFRVGAHRRGARGREHRRGMPRLARARRRRGRSHRADLRHAVRVLPLLPRRRIRGFRIWRPRLRGPRCVHRGVRPRFLHRGDGALAAPLLGDAHLRREHRAVHLNGRDHRQDHHGGGDG